MSQELEQRVIDVARQIFSSKPARVEPAQGGVSTLVYRILFPNETFYLRLLPDPADSFASEVAVHMRLRLLGVQAPEVVHFEHFNQTLQRSVMMTTAINGEPVSQSGALGETALQAIMSAAGRDLARINTIAVDGFGRLRGRAETDQLVAPHRLFRATMLQGWEEAVRFLAGGVLAASESHALEQLLARHNTWLDLATSQLAHGDFSARHVFQQAGQYTGVIDFGDSLGTDRWYDAAYFHMRDGGLLPYRLETALLNGYREITPLPDDIERRIRFLSVSIAVKLLADGLRQRAGDAVNERLLARLREDLAALG